ncbi:MAG: hypothetical protein H2172_03360 [Opitutus sp.]|nr:hypothetical protein [Opitutus sp.]MCS6248589.1 hypothetical protein [Opitutus sp.]MCS6275551.1 hypothetical protein [Opitutus sp.]MCS6299035.1 hypothetical protein [Opitutus sp.]
MATSEVRIVLLLLLLLSPDAFCSRPGLVHSRSDNARPNAHATPGLAPGPGP